MSAATPYHDVVETENKVGRPGITYEDVKARADMLVALGLSPTVRNVRRALGDTGAMETIGRHLRQYWADKRVIESSEPAAKLVVAPIQGNLSAAESAVAELKNSLNAACTELGSVAERLTIGKTSLQATECNLHIIRDELRNAESLLKDLRQCEVTFRQAVAKLQEVVVAARYELEQLAPWAERIAGLETELQRERAMRALAESRANELLMEVKSAKID